MIKKFVILDDVLDVLIEEGILKSKNTIPRKRNSKKEIPTWFPPCPTCNYTDVECVCVYNDLLKKLNDIKPVGRRYC